MLLGDLIAHFADEELVSETLFSLDDFFLAARVEDAASRQEITPGAFAGVAVQRFAASASDEDWVTLIGKMGQSDDPGGIFLRHILEWSLEARIGQLQKGCACH